MMKFLFDIQINSEAFCKLTLSFWVSAIFYKLIRSFRISRQDQSIQNKTFAYLWGINMEDKVHVKVRDHDKVLDPRMFIVNCFIKEFVGILPECLFDKYSGSIFSDALIVSIFTISERITTLSLMVLSQIVSIIFV